MTTKTTTKTRPIIMGAESVRAILAGRKTQTRRVVKYIPAPVEPGVNAASIEAAYLVPFIVNRKED